MLFVIFPRSQSSDKLNVGKMLIVFNDCITVYARRSLLVSGNDSYIIIRQRSHYQVNFHLGSRPATSAVQGCFNVAELSIDSTRRCLEFSTPNTQHDVIIDSALIICRVCINATPEQFEVRL